MSDFVPTEGFEPLGGVKRRTSPRMRPGTDKPVEEVRLEGLGIGFREAASQALGIIEDAKAEAQSIRQQAQAELDAAFEQARANGFNQGRMEGIAAADDEMAALIQTAESIAALLASERMAFLEKSEEEVIRLAVAVAGKIVGASIECENSLVVDVCRSAMRKAFQRDHLTVLANPEDLELLRSVGPRLQDELGGIHVLDIVEERRMERGSVSIRTPAGEIDATVLGKSSRIVEKLTELIEVSRASDTDDWGD